MRKFIPSLQTNKIKKINASQALVVAAVFGVIGTLLLYETRAATPTASFEAESGSVSSAASAVADTTASGSSAVKFGTSAAITNGEQMNATNTGLAGDGISASSLTPVSGSVTYGTSFNGQTISMKSYTGTVTISGNNITLKDCKVYTGGLNVDGIVVTGDNDTVQNCLITAPPNQSLSHGVWIPTTGSDSAHIYRNDISRSDNLLTTYGTNVQIMYNYMHETENASDPSDHPDGMEIYGGGPVNIQYNRIVEGDLYDSPINAAPYNNYTLTDMSVVDNFLDNGQAMTLIDNQSTAQPGQAGIRNTRIERNVMGGHSNPDTNGSLGIYAALENYDNRPIVQDEAGLTANPLAILWPTSGANANHWGECSDLVPDKTGQIVLPQ